MAFKFIALFATLAFANAGLIAEQPAYTSYSYSQPQVKTVAYAADAYHHAPASSSSYVKTTSYSQPKAYVAAQPAIASYHSYEPQQHYAVSSYQQPQQHVYAAAAPVYGQYSHGSSEQNIVRSAHGTVSHISKHVDTPHSSVSKYDTRVINDGYKTVAYAQPAAYVHAQPTAYVAHQPAAYVHAQPAVHYSAPVVTKTLAQPVIAKTIVSQPIHQYSAQPAHYQTYAAQPQYQTYAHAPALATKVAYSPAFEVAHASFESPAAHYSW